MHEQMPLTKWLYANPEPAHEDWWLCLNAAHPQLGPCHAHSIVPLEWHFVAVMLLLRWSLASYAHSSPSTESHFLGINDHLTLTVDQRHLICLKGSWRQMAASSVYHPRRLSLSHSSIRSHQPPTSKSVSGMDQLILKVTVCSSHFCPMWKLLVRMRKHALETLSPSSFSSLP